MDETDRRILGILASDGRASVQSIAERVGLRRPSVHARIRRLEEDGTIASYHARLAPEKVGRGVTAFVFVEVAHGGGQDCLTSCGSIVTALAQVPAVEEAHTLAGNEDMVLKVRVGGLRELEDLVLRRISGLPMVKRVRTSMALRTNLERPTGPPEAAATKRPRRGAARGRRTTTVR